MDLGLILQQHLPLIERQRQIALERQAIKCRRIRREIARDNALLKLGECVRAFDFLRESNIVQLGDRCARARQRELESARLAVDIDCVGKFPLDRRQRLPQLGEGRPLETEFDRSSSDRRQSRLGQQMLNPNGEIQRQTIGADGAQLATQNAKIRNFGNAQEAPRDATIPFGTGQVIHFDPIKGRAPGTQAI
jgi:hypothetical protein